MKLLRLFLVVFLFTAPTSLHAEDGPEETLFVHDGGVWSVMVTGEGLLQAVASDGDVIIGEITEGELMYGESGPNWFRVTYGQRGSCAEVPEIAFTSWDQLISTPLLNIMSGKGEKWSSKLEAEGDEAFVLEEDVPTVLDWLKRGDPAIVTSTKLTNDGNLERSHIFSLAGSRATFEEVERLCIAE